MTSFITDNFILQSSLAENLYADFAKDQPIIDYHNHLLPEQIASNHRFENITQAWLYGDHYKWRAMRALGIDERYITGNTSDFEKFEKWAYTIPFTLRNPLYHWTHMELKNPFGIDALLSLDNAKEIYAITSDKLQSDSFSTQGLLTHYNVEMVGTTDDPVDSLDSHVLLQRQDSFKTKVKPSFRPDKVFLLSGGGTYRQYLDRLSEAAVVQIRDIDSLLEALSKRIDFFDGVGCVASDYGLATIPSRPLHSVQDVDIAFKEVLMGNDEKALAYEESFTFYILAELSKLYHAKGWVQQFHLGALRNTNKQKLSILGADTGYDTIGDFRHAERMAYFFNYLESTEQLPKTIIYNNNPSDNAVFATMIGNFQGDGIRGKIQFGSGWWYLDQLDGMTEQINSLSNFGLISGFIGMLTDSRSFLSFSRHDYFRRILCNIFAEDIKKGYLPNDLIHIGSIIKDISYTNAKKYFKD